MRVDSSPSPKQASTVLAGNKRAMSGGSYLAKISFRGWPSSRDRVVLRHDHE
jgi:hypothetical protein